MGPELGVEVVQIKLVLRADGRGNLFMCSKLHEGTHRIISGSASAFPGLVKAACSPRWWTAPAQKSPWARPFSQLVLQTSSCTEEG
eukprot:1159034-Pelagomonas_calceolata.AAC.4